MIKTGSDFRNVMHFLSPDQRTAVYQDFKNNLPSIINKSSDFRDALIFLTLDQRTAIYQRFPK